MLADSRIRAGIDMDGSTAAAIPDEGLARPFLFLGKQSNYTPGSGGAVATLREWKLLRSAVITWERDWELLTGWKRWLVVADAVHASFTDLALLADQIGIDTGASLSGARSLDITRAYVQPSSTSTCAAGRKPCLTSRHHATPRSRSAPRKLTSARDGGPPRETADREKLQDLRVQSATRSNSAAAESIETVRAPGGAGGSDRRRVRSGSAVPRDVERPAAVESRRRSHHGGGWILHQDLRRGPLGGRIE